jgi:pimeloyl-ACP methyl ester carboxylesterase
MGLMELYEAGVRVGLRLSGVKMRPRSTPHGTLCVYDWQSGRPGPTVVLLHGIATNTTSWLAVLLGLRACAGRILAVDHLGHGWSERPGVVEPEALYGAMEAALLAELGAPAIVVANSMGGALALRFGADHPEVVQSLALFSPAGAPWSEAEITALRTLFSMPTPRATKHFLDRLLGRATFLTWLLVPDVRRRFADPALRHLIGRFHPDQAITPAQLARIPSPSLLIWGGAEQVLPMSSVAYFRTHFRGLVEEPAGWSHSPQVDRPWSAIRRLRRWITTGG